jgi:pimeloyl-ACP methyl ester carboxylesterase
MVGPMERGMMEHTVYLRPGRGNRLQDLGETIASLGFDVWGREIFPPFSTLNFAEQIQIIQNDLRSWFWHEEAKLVGHSYGGYLLLQALADLEAFPGSILLISPVLGAARGKLYLSRPPRADRLLKLAEEHPFPVPQGLEIHTGEADDGCDPDLARRIGASIPGAQVHVVPHTGHALPIDYLNKVIHRFLVRSDKTLRVDDGATPAKGPPGVTLVSQCSLVRKRRKG